MNDDRRSRADEREQQHGVEKELRLRRHRDAQDRQIEAFAAAGEIGHAVDDLAQHLGDDQARDREIMPAQMQDRAAEEGRERHRREAGAAPGQHHRRAVILQDRRSVGAEAEERRGGERRIARKPADEIPRLRHHRIHADRGREPQKIVVAGERRAPRAATAIDGKRNPIPHS